MSTDYLVLTFDDNQVVSDLSPLYVEDGRLRNESGFEHINGVSDFAAIWYIMNGREEELKTRLDYYQFCNRRDVRSFCMLNWANNGGPTPIEFSPFDSGFWDAAHRLTELNAQRGMYTYLDLFADAQRFNRLQREYLVHEFADFYNSHVDCVLPGLCNEAQFNGFKSAIDPELLSYAKTFAALIGHFNFVISDSLDGESEEDTEISTNIYVILADYSNILAMHPSRTRTGDEWRWINHLKTFADQISTVKQKTGNKNIYGFHREPMGAAGQDSGNRDSNPYHHIAANFVANCCGLGYVAHYIPEQDPTFPGLDIMGLARQISASPDFQYINAGLGGSSVRSFSGYEKVRPLQNGKDMFAVGYGGDGSIDSDYIYDTIYSSVYVKLYHGTR